MKISSDQVRKVLEGYIRQVEDMKAPRAKGVDAKGDTLTVRADSVTLTARSRVVERAKEKYDELPDVRRDLVEELKGKLASDDYDVSNKEVADKIIHRLIVDKTV